MPQKSLLFLHMDEAKIFNEELELNSLKAFFFTDFVTVSVICITISMLGLIGNGIIFWLLCWNIKKTKFTIYIANMVAADFLALLRTFLSFLEVFFPFINTAARQLMLVVFFFGHETNCFFLAAMSTERCLTVFSPVWYQSHRKKYSTAYACTILWTVSVTLKLLDHFLCTFKYMVTLNLGIRPCNVVTVVKRIIIFFILTFTMIISTLALCIRMKRKPQQDFPARLDISIWITVVLNLLFSPGMEIMDQIFWSFLFRYFLDFYYLSLAIYCLKYSVNPFVYLLVGCWKWEKGQEPFYMFLERALKDNGTGSVRTQPDQPDQEQA